MNISITMKMTLVLFWLCSGFFYSTSASYRLRRFSIADKRSDWTMSLDECRKENASFVTVYDDEDAKFVRGFAKSKKGNIWLGLRKNESVTANTWSNGEPLTFPTSSVNVSDGSQKCEAIDRNTWRAFDCSEKKYFMCYRGNNYTLIQSNKSWCQALQYCRKHFRDLVSISNETQNEEVIEKGNDTTFWIGLLHDHWEWEDRGCSNFRKFHNWDSDKICTACTLRSVLPDILSKHQCHVQAYSFCSEGTVRIKVIDIPMTWEDAFDYCRENHTGLLWIRDSNDEEALRQWLNKSDVDGPFWIGLRQSRVFGFWFWTSESDNAVTIDRWKNGEPQLPLSNHCALIDKDMGWSDEDCLVEHRFLCEEEILFMNQG